jgi:threonine dehydrogenase-like Zn-dependent dehydrogenase
MKALVWTEPKTMIISEIEKPVPGVGEVLIRVSSTGICGSELSGYLGENSLRKPPLIMGHEFCGRIEGLGEAVDSSLTGRQVVVNPLIPCRKCHMCRNGYENRCLHFSLIGAHRPGAFAEWVTVPDYACYVVEDTFGVIEGTLVEPLACSMRAVRLGKVSTMDKVVIFGAGIIGLTSLRMAKFAGASQVIVVDTNPKRLDIALQWGATKVVYADQENVVKRCLDMSNGFGIDVVIDAVGLPITRLQSIEIVRRGGTIVFCGLHSNETIIPGNVIVRSEINIVGSFAYTYKDFQNSLEYMIENTLVPITNNWLDERPLEQGNRSFQELISGSRFAKIVLNFN